MNRDTNTAGNTADNAIIKPGPEQPAATIQSGGETAYDRFEGFARKLTQVPKPEVDEQRKASKK